MEMDYSQLPEDILVKMVEDHLPSFSNLILFSHVCKSWRIAARESIAAERRPPPCRPGLLLSRSYSDSHEFLPLANFAAAMAPPPPPPRRRLKIRRRVLIPLGFDSDYSNYIRSRRYYGGHKENPCIASKDGWVLVIEPGPSPDPLRLQLLNPVSRQSIPLPPLLLPCPPRAQFTVDNIFKAVISSPPEDGCYVFLLFHFDYENVTLACTNVGSCNEFGRTQTGKEGRRGSVGEGGGGWKMSYLDPMINMWPGDASYYGGKLYIAVGEEGSSTPHRTVCVLHNLTTTPTVAASIPFTPAMSSHYNNDEDEGFSYQNTYLHLCHLNGQLLVIFRRHPPYHRDHPHPDPITFYIYKLHATGHCWQEVRDLDGHALFLGHSHPAFCLPAADDVGFKRDRIYFALSVMYGYNTSYYVSEMYSNNCGVFSVVDRRLEVFAKRPFDKHNYFWFLLTPSDVFSSSTIQDGGNYRLVRRARLRLRKRRQALYRKAFNHRINYAEIARNVEHPKGPGSYIDRHTNTCTTSVPVLATEWTTIPRKTVKNHHHKNSKDTNVIVATNRFRALVDDDHQDMNAHTY